MDHVTLIYKHTSNRDLGWLLVVASGNLLFRFRDVHLRKSPSGSQEKDIVNSIIVQAMDTTYQKLSYLNHIQGRKIHAHGPGHLSQSRTIQVGRDDRMMILIDSQTGTNTAANIIVLHTPVIMTKNTNQDVKENGLTT